MALQKSSSQSQIDMHFSANQAFAVFESVEVTSIDVMCSAANDETRSVLG